MLEAGQCEGWCVSGVELPVAKEERNVREAELVLLFVLLLPLFAYPGAWRRGSRLQVSSTRPFFWRYYVPHDSPRVKCLVRLGGEGLSLVGRLGEFRGGEKGIEVSRYVLENGEKLRQDRRRRRRRRRR